MTTVLTKGGNALLPTGICRVTLTPAGTHLDVCAVLLTQEGTVRGDEDLVFYNNPSHDGVSLSGQDRSGQHRSEQDRSGQEVHADLANVPTAVDRIAIVAGLDPRTASARFDAGSTPAVLVECEGSRVSFAPPPFAHGESAAILVEIYRRAGSWKVRAVGQGWDTGLAGLATDFGVVVDDDGTGPRGPAAVTTAPQTGASPGPAISLDKMQKAAPGLVDLYEAAHVSLVKHDVLGRRAAVYLVLDHSGSMWPFYENGTMQHLAEQALGLSANLDDDGLVPLVFFSHGVELVTDIGLENYQGRIDTLHPSLNWGGTTYAPAMQAVIDHYQASGSTDPAFVIFQTDGEPFDRKETRELLRRTSSMPIFWQFVGFGSSRNLRFLRSLDTLTGRTVDNAGYFGAGKNPEQLSVAALYDLLMKEFPAWLTAARTAGVLR